MTKNASSGFTVIETVVTILIAAMLIVAVNGLFTSVIRATAGDRYRSEASNLAYSTMRKYAYSGATPNDWFTCPAGSDLQATPGGSGQELGAGNIAANDTTLPQPVSYRVAAYAPYGCGGNPSPPVLVRSEVTYGPDAITVTHATYVEYGS